MESKGKKVSIMWAVAPIFFLCARSKETVAAAAGCFKVKAPAGGFDLQKKLIRLPCKLRYNLWFVQGQSNKFFSPMLAP